MPGRLAAWLAATLLLLPMFLPVVALAADTEGSASVTGQVTVQASTPTVSFMLYSDSGYSQPTTEITPQTPVYMKITVSGNNPLEEYEITVHIFADTDNAAVGTPPSSTSPETYVNFTISYDSGSGQWVLTSDTGGSSTWSIQLDPNQNQPSPTAASGDFYVVITFGKTAREANTGDTSVYADWDIIVEATVAGSATGSASAYGYTVYFYGEISAQASTIDFGTIEAGQSSLIQYVDGNPQNYFEVLVVANGYYDLKATSSSTWTHTSDNTKTITLTTSTTIGEGEFALQVDDEFDSTNNDLVNPVPVPSDPASASPFVDDAGPTTERGSVTSVYMKIMLGTNIYTGTYQGTITIYVVDGS